MISRNNFAVVCLGIALGAQGCALLLGYDEDKPTVMQAGGGNGGAGGIAGAGGAGGNEEVPCTSASTCPGEDDACKKRTCMSGMCGVEFVAAGTVCNTSGACDGAGVCKKDIGALCTAPEQCFNGLCVDGLCCDTGCTDTCKACNVTGTEGMCTNVAMGVDDVGTCAGTNDSCDGAGACKKENGQGCASASDCSSGFCVDGVCCNSACTADATGINTCASGTCTNRSWAAWPMPNPVGTGLPNPSSYTIDTANGTVFDDVTKLMWQRDVDPGFYTWDDAKTYCSNLVYGGYSDWRLPTRIELVSLVDFTVPSPGPTIDTVAFPNTPNNLFWTSSSLAGSPSHAWDVTFYSGKSFNDQLTLMSRVRCVR